VANHLGKVKFLNVAAVINKDGETVAISRTGKLVILDERQREKERYSVAYGSHLLVEDGQDVDPGTPLVEWDPFTSSILTAIKGKVKFHDLVEGENVREEIDKLTGHAHKIVIEPLGSGKRIPTTEIVGNKKDETRRYQLPIGSHLSVNENDRLAAGDVLAKIPREMSKTRDITGGLPRVADLFEARKPKEPAILAEASGTVSFGKDTKGKQRVVITDADGQAHEELIPKWRHVNVFEGEHVEKGEVISDGELNPHDILRLRGVTQLADYLVKEIQDVYRLQGVKINDKHIEVIVRQMLRKVRVNNVGDTDFLVGEQVDKVVFEEANQRMLDEGKKPAVAEPLLLGITKASLSTESFISAASFQETTKVLTDAAVGGRVDFLRGLKENVIMGRLIPAGTGLKQYRDMVSGEKEEAAGSS